MPRIGPWAGCGVPMVVAGLVSGAVSADLPPDTGASSGGSEPRWSWHLQNTEIVQGHSSFPAAYSGMNSLRAPGDVRETVSLDLMLGLRLWRGAEVHADGLMWQGYGLANAHGAAAFPNGEAFRVGTAVPNGNLARLFVRQTLGLGGAGEEPAEEGPFSFPGSLPSRRLTLTVGKLSAKDVFDGNAYANDPRTQFMNWGLMANQAWDFPADPLGYTTGAAADLTIDQWSFRTGFFQVPRVSNGAALDSHYLKAWGMVEEVERRWKWGERPGAVRVLGFLNQAHMGSYQAAVDAAARPADIEATRAYRHKHGFGLNLEQEIVAHVGAFSRIGWSDGRNESWAFADVDRTVTGGFSLEGTLWNRPGDTWGVAGIFNDITRTHAAFFAAGGTGILAGDGTLNPGWERAIETYYDLQLCSRAHFSLDYQCIVNPAYNRDRGPVSIFGARLHWAL